LKHWIAAYVRQLSPDEPQPLAVEAVVEAPLVDLVTGEDLGIPLLGIMDLVLAGQDSPVISDFKTAGRSSKPLETTHEIQLTSYAYWRPLALPLPLPNADQRPPSNHSSQRSQTESPPRVFSHFMSEIYPEPGK
jgi:hypothetical protein